MNTLDKKKGSAFYRFRCFFALLALPFVVSAQPIATESPEEILKQRQEVFRQIVAREDSFKDSLWYQGRIYEFALGSELGTPNFLDLSALKGKLRYQGIEHEGLLLSYNLVMDELIIREKVNEFNIIELVLNKYFVEHFTLEHQNYYYRFRMHTEKKPIHEQLKEGFYEVVYDDKLMMLIRHKKVLFFDASKSDHYSYRYERQIYLIVDGEIYDVTSRKGYLRSLPDYRRPLRKYMRQANIFYEREGSQSLSALCAFSKSLLYQYENGIEGN